MVSVSKASNYFMYMQRHGIFKDCLYPDVHDMMSQILTVLIDFTKDCTSPCVSFCLFPNL